MSLRLNGSSGGPARSHVQLDTIYVHVPDQCSRRSPPASYESSDVVIDVAAKGFLAKFEVQSVK